jgi:hypothetical protein
VIKKGLIEFQEEMDVLAVEAQVVNVEYRPVEVVNGFGRVKR